jgi:hypothetical protein
MHLALYPINNSSINIGAPITIPLFPAFPLARTHKIPIGSGTKQRRAVLPGVCLAGHLYPSGAPVLSSPSATALLPDLLWRWRRTLDRAHDALRRWWRALASRGRRALAEAVHPQLARTTLPVMARPVQRRWQPPAVWLLQPSWSSPTNSFMVLSRLNDGNGVASSGGSV